MKRHDIWRRVEYDYQEATKRAPEGHEPVVQVYVAGRPDPIIVSFVETRRPADETWIRFSPGADPNSETVEADQYWVHVPENCVLAIEIPSRAHPSGFTTARATSKRVLFVAEHVGVHGSARKPPGAPQARE